MTWLKNFFKKAEQAMSEKTGDEELVSNLVEQARSRLERAAAAGAGANVQAALKALGAARAEPVAHESSPSGVISLGDASAAEDVTPSLEDIAKSKAKKK